MQQSRHCRITQSLQHPPYEPTSNYFRNSTISRHSTNQATTTQDRTNNILILDMYRARACSQLGNAGHNRPFWTRSEVSYRVHFDDPRPQRNVVDHFENFSYKAEHHDAWLAPDGVLQILPESLQHTVKDWQKAGAALSTALERTEAFASEALSAAYPKGSRRNSEQTISGAQQPFNSPPMMLPPPIGMESPPYTPYDSFACPTPLSLDMTSQKAVDARTLHLELSPLSIADDLYPVRPRLDGFNEVSWEHYTERHDALIKDCQIALQRLKGYKRTIDITLIEEKSQPDLESKSAFESFDKWWTGMQTKAEALETQVQELDVPTLGEVTAMANAGIASW
ncbi:hypothetical protein LTR27_003778 [Elasticomyces elasticus]|nr:hypothetical protein LTR27_003778 [Elasticomyces elasticus]